MKELYPSFNQARWPIKGFMQFLPFCLAPMTVCIATLHRIARYSVQNLESAWERKQGKKEYQEIQSEFDRLGVRCFYSTIELSVAIRSLYLSPSLSSLQNCINFVDETTMITARKIFDLAASISISTSRRIFLAKDCSEWTLEC